MNRALIKINHRYVHDTTKARATVYCYIEDDKLITNTEELRQKFVPDQTVFWRNIPDDITDEGYYWAELTEVPTDGTIGHCNFGVRASSKSSNVIGAVELICDGIGFLPENERDFRMAFIEVGIQADVFTGASVKFYYSLPQTLCNEMSLPKNSWIGPIELVLRDDNFYTLKPDTTVLGIREFDSSKIFMLDEGVRFTWQRINETKIIGYICLESDLEIVRKLNSEVYLGIESLDSTSLDPHTIEALKRRINAASLLYDADTLKYKAYLHRIQNLIDRIDETHQIKKESIMIIDQYIERLEGSKNIAIWKDNFYKRQQDEIKSSFEAQKKAFNLQKEEWKLKWDAQKAQQEDEEEKRITEFEQQFDLLKENMGQEQLKLANLLEAGKRQQKELAECLNKVIDEHKPIFNTLAYLHQNYDIQDNAKMKDEKNVTFNWSNLSCPTFSEQDDLSVTNILNAISEHSSYFEIESTRLKDSLNSLITSRIPCFTGAKALDAAQALASIIASTNYNIVSVPAAVFSVYDLFCKIVPGSELQNEYPYSLLSFLYHAHNNPEHTFAVILEGMNRCPLESYLDALAAAYYHAMEKPTIFDTMVEMTDPQQILTPKIRWPKNVYLIGTLVRGRTTFKIEPNYLDSIELVDAFSTGYDQNESKSHKCCHNDFILKRIENHIDKFEKALLVGRDKVDIGRIVSLLNYSSQDWNREKQKLSQVERARIEYNRYYIEYQEP